MEYEPPSQLNENTVIYWSRHYRELVGNIRSKARKLVRHNCIQYIGKDGSSDAKHSFISLPLSSSEGVDIAINGEIRHFDKKPFGKNYNSDVTNYRMFLRDDKRWFCDCQGWRAAESQSKRKLDGVQCSHLLALFLCFRLKRFSRDQGSNEDLERLDPLKDLG